jgi:hypothetical protein
MSSEPNFQRSDPFQTFKQVGFLKNSISKNILNGLETEKFTKIGL